MRFKKHLTEGSAFFNKTVQKIAKMTDQNDHTNALAMGLELMGLDPEAMRAQKLARKIEKAGGYSPGDAMAKEYKKLYDTLMYFAKDELSPEDYKKLHGAF